MLLFSQAIPITVSANSDSSESFEYEFTDGMIVCNGGLNEYNGKAFGSREEALITDQDIRNKNYVLVSTDLKEISEEDYQILYDGGFWFTSYLNSDNLLQWTKDKVYIYKPSLEKYLDEMKTSNEADLYTLMEIEISGIVFAYDYWYSKDKVGKISGEFNDNISPWNSPAYMEIDSPIDIEIVLENKEQKTFYIFYVSKDTPFAVRLPQAQYNVISVNAVEIEQYEEVLPSSNIIVLNEEHADRDNPYVVNITELVNKYSIPSIDLSGKPDLSLDQNQNIPEESTIVYNKDIIGQYYDEYHNDTSENTDSEKDTNKNIYIYIVVCVLAIIVINMIFFTRRKLNKRKDR